MHSLGKVVLFDDDIMQARAIDNVQMKMPSNLASHR